MESVKNIYLNLLREWMDALMSCMVRDEKHPTLDGGILCPACSMIHGRCADAVYPLLCLSEHTRDKRYLGAAKRLFNWSEYMLCDDGSVYNDSQSEWNGVTVFTSIALHHALKYHGVLLNEAEKLRWETRLKRHADWLKLKIRPDSKMNVNYLAANAAAMALLGEYFGDNDLLSRAKPLADRALSCFCPSGLIFGEGSLRPDATPRGMCAVDMGYNAEETLPCLYDYARAVGDAEAMEKVMRAVKAHADFMLPDGAWDNSFGSRNFKWTYWGGRTSDGCQALFNALGWQEPSYAEMALRNLLLYRRCTHGLLYGGPDYRRHGEQPCVHHAFCHAKALAQALDEGICEFERTRIPSDDPKPLRHYPEAGLYRLALGKWRMSVCYNDFEYMKGGHASGGAVTLLWHGERGPVAASANTDYSLREPHNQQLTRRKALQGSLCPALELLQDGTVFSQAYDYNAHVSAACTDHQIKVSVSGSLCGIDHQPIGQGGSYILTYTLTEQSLTICAEAPKIPGIRFRLPVIFGKDRTVQCSPDRIVVGGDVTVQSKGKLTYEGEVFALAPGFEAACICAYPDVDGKICLTLAM